MHLEHLITRLLQKAKDKLRELTKPTASPTQATPPSVNHANKPQLGPGGAPYWHPSFHPSIPLWTYFEQETGATGWGNNEAQNYTQSPANSFFTADHKLVIRALARPYASHDPYTSARLVSEQKLTRDRGCLTARLSLPSAPGIWPAFWLLPAEPCCWPTDGEIDICEAWNGDPINHSCLHWGNYTAEDSQKHRVMQTPMGPPGMSHEFSLVWDQGPRGSGGRLLWYVNARPVMRACLPDGIRPMRDFRIILNVAMGGNVCQGTLPAEGVYDMVVHELKMMDEPAGGWRKFSYDWDSTADGKTM